MALHLPVRKFLVWSLPSVAILLSYLWYKKRRIGALSDSGGRSEKEKFTNTVSNQTIDNSAVRKEKEAEEKARIPATPQKLNRSLSGVETAPINIIYPRKQLKHSKSHSPATVISDEDLDLEIEKIKSMRTQYINSPSTILANTPSPVKLEPQKSSEATTTAFSPIAEVKKESFEHSPVSTKKVSSTPVSNSTTPVTIPTMPVDKSTTPVRKESTSVTSPNSTSPTTKKNRGVKKVQQNMVQNELVEETDLKMNKETDELPPTNATEKLKNQDTTQICRRNSSGRDSANHSPCDLLVTASPSLSFVSDNHSEGSSDSGKGGSNAATPPPRPQLDNVTTYYDFVIPQNLVGKLIGRQGAFMQRVKDKCNAEIFIRRHPTNNRLKLCTIEGTQSEIDKALKMIREKFPLKKYSEISLERVQLTPVVPTVSLIPDCLYLKLIEGINNDTILSCMVAPDHLFMQQPTHPSFPSLSLLGSCMNQCYNSQANSPLLPSPIPENTVCAAYSTGFWYRAIVLSSDEKESYVKFLDYGGYSFVENDKLRQIRQDFMLLPFQAAECFLANIKPKTEDGTWPEGAYNLITNITKGSIIYTQVADYTPDGVPLVLCYVISNPQEAVFINQKLVDEGYADWIPQFQEETNAPLEEPNVALKLKMHGLLSKLDAKPTYPVGKVNGLRSVSVFEASEFESDEEVEDENEDNLYEQQFVQEELTRYTTDIRQDVGFADDVSSNYDVTNMGETMLLENKHNPQDVYQKYNFKLNTDIKSELPIDSFRNQILSRIKLNQVIVIQGPTGCGKTTQIPQMVMDSLREKNEYCNIAVTQPRKIATINVAKRVCDERGWTMGSVCGYQVGLEKKTSPEQLITYMTTGVLLQKLIRKKSLREYTHIIIDEVHERNQDLDFLLLIVRKFLFTNSPHVKVILMSATINADEFAFYFRKQTDGQAIPAPVIKVDKISQYNKKIFYVDQCTAFTEKAKFEKSLPEISVETWKMFIFLIKVFDKLGIDADEQETYNSGSVLVFLPGINEIEEAHNLLIKEQINKDSAEVPEGAKPKLKWEIIPLHSSLPNDEQAKAFKKSKPGYRKIILSTNIAESSVTVPDSRYVIDFCLTKVMTVDPITKYLSLKLEWASHVNCEQRAGRVGRTCDGRVYRLVSKKFYMEEMERFGLPEILRAPLERIVLNTKMLDLNETPSQILALAMNPPSLSNIESTMWKLKEIGGLLKTCRGILSNADGDITFMGQIMANLPIDVHLSKLIVLGQLFSCLEETVIIAAGCSIQNIFSVPFQKRLDAYKKVLLWSDGSCSDLIALLNLYTVWQNLKRENAFANHKQELEWCQRNLISLKGLREWQLLFTEIKERLDRLQVKETVGPAKVKLSDIEKPTVLKVVMAGAFYPNYFVKSPEGNHKDYEREAVKTIGGRNPFSTIYFTGFDPKQPGHIYVRQIKRMIQDQGEHNTDVHVGFDGSMKVYVEFKNFTDPIAINVDGFNRLSNTNGKIPRQLYELLRKRQLKYDFVLQVLPYKDAWQFAEKNGVERGAYSRLPGATIDASSSVERNCFSSIKYSPIPSMDTQFIQINISNQIDAGHFWAQNSDSETNELLHQIDEALNKQALKKVDEPLKIGKVYAARFREDNMFYRCRLVTTAGRVNQILFIDYGNIQEVTGDELYYLPQRPQCFVNALAFECVLYGIKPAYRCNPTGTWNERINEHFRELSEGIVLCGEVYSVVNDVVELELYRSAVKELSVNQHLIKQGYAEPCAPSYLSKQNHDQRMMVQAAENPSEEAVRMSVDHIVSYADFADPGIQNSYPLRLKGPFNPLECRLFGCTYLGSTKAVDVEGISVNAVLLDTEPESPHSRLLVAGYVGQNSEGHRLKLRQTTLMPNVPGFPMLLASIFCPTMEPKLSADNSVVAAILCGLGYNESNNKPLYPAHDMILRLDTVLKSDELEMINRLRYLMNNGIKLMYEMAQNRSTQNELLRTQIKIKDHLFSLIHMEREPIDLLNVSPQNTIWGKHCGVGLLKPSLDNEEQDIWPLLWFVSMSKLTAYQKTIAKNLEDMENMIYGVTPFEEITCQVCQITSLFLQELRMHVTSGSHKREMERYLMETEDVDSDA